jgi:cytoskeletal protein RodZ
MLLVGNCLLLLLLVGKQQLLLLVGKRLLLLLLLEVVLVVLVHLGFWIVHTFVPHSQREVTEQSSRAQLNQHPSVGAFIL